MSALDRLADLLRSCSDLGKKPLPADNTIDEVIEQLLRNTRSGTQARVPEDLQQQAIHRFWEAQRFDNLSNHRIFLVKC